ncbi:MAG: hypothetical protein R2882_08715 [Gemmatimonadales bacterium]
MLTGVLVMGGLGYTLIRIFNGPVGQALARRLQGKGGVADQELLNEVGELRHAVESMQQRLLDTEERLDFSERLLAQRAESSERGG